MPFVQRQRRCRAHRQRRHKVAACGTMAFKCNTLVLPAQRRPLHLLGGKQRPRHRGSQLAQLACLPHLVVLVPARAMRQ